MRELKTIACNGDMVKGDIFEVIDQEENYRLRFRINELISELPTGEMGSKTVRLRYNLDQLIEFRDEIDSVITRMKQEL